MEPCHDRALETGARLDIQFEGNEGTFPNISHQKFIQPGHSDAPGSFQLISCWAGNGSSEGLEKATVTIEYKQGSFSCTAQSDQTLRIHSKVKVVPTSSGRASRVGGTHLLENIAVGIGDLFLSRKESNYFNASATKHSSRPTEKVPYLHSCISTVHNKELSLVGGLDATWQGKFSPT